MSDLVIRSKGDVAAFVNDQPMTRAGLGVVLIALGGVFVDAYDFASLGIGVPGLSAEFHLQPSQLGLIASIMGVGAVLGGIAGGYLADRVGRLRMFIIDLICLVVATLGASLAPNIYVLFFFRFLIGVGVGLDYPVAFSFLAEIVNTRRRGGSIASWVFIWQVAVAVSVLVALVIYYLGFTEHLWRFAVGFGAVPALIILALRGKYMWESPLWAANYVGLPEAARLLQKTYGVSVRVVDGYVPAVETTPVTYSAIFLPPYGLRTLLVSIISITQSSGIFCGRFLSAVDFGRDLWKGIRLRRGRNTCFDDCRGHWRFSCGGIRRPARCTEIVDRRLYDHRYVPDFILVDRGPSFSLYFNLAHLWVYSRPDAGARVGVCLDRCPLLSDALAWHRHRLGTRYGAGGNDNRAFLLSAASGTIWPRKFDAGAGSCPLYRASLTLGDQVGTNWQQY